jgi:hypothetical protein
MRDAGENDRRERKTMGKSRFLFFSSVYSEA